MPSEGYKRIIQRCEALAIKPTKQALHASIARQELELWSDGTLAKVYRISTSRKPPSCIADSRGTPSGLHRIAEKIGGEAPLGMVFKGRQPIGRLHTEMSLEEQAANLITTRILRLRGLEPGLNSGPGCDSYDRYVYIHGTNHEDRIGQPQSAGCLLLANSDVAELFELVDAGALLLIE
jgi:hypothetical protein